MKLRKLIISIAALLVCTLSEAQVNLGVKAGVSGSWISGVVLTPGARVIPHPSFYAGVSADVQIGEDLVAQAEVIYAGKGHSEVTTVGDIKNKYTLNMGYLQIPAMIGYRLGDGKCTLMAGPELGILLHAKDIDNLNGFVTKTDCREICNLLNLGLAVQANYMFLPNLGVDVKFDWGVTRTFKQSAYQEIGLKGNSHNMSVQLGLCYVFGL